MWLLRWILSLDAANDGQNYFDRGKFHVASRLSVYDCNIVQAGFRGAGVRAPSLPRRRIEAAMRCNVANIFEKIVHLVPRSDLLFEAPGLRQEINTKSTFALAEWLT